MVKGKKMYIVFYNINEEDKKKDFNELYKQTYYDWELIDDKDIKNTTFEKDDVLFKISVQQIPIKYKEKKLVTIKKSYFAEV
jgi:hypothetical protein